MICLASGLLNLINEIESGRIEPGRKIQGNPYFLKSSNFQNFGFQARDLDCFEKIRFYLNYIELSFLKSIVSRKLVLVKVDKLKIVYTNALTLLENKNKILSYYHKLSKNKQVSFEKNNPEFKVVSKTAV
jgi:hypothetical protein